tara:strand:- start:52 stop:684 length:633 start_codon:yes stop_codon:yes gene_type:complete
MNKQMLIIAGPQGAGNHLWAKVFSQHPDVFGWKSLLENYWEPHRFNEPFAKYWRDPSILDQFDWSQSDYYVTSISVPLGIPDSKENPMWEPNIDQFKRVVELEGVDVKVALIGRDQNILSEQQHRIRNKSTLPMFKKQLKTHTGTSVYLSYELLYLYKDQYVETLDVNIPVDSNVGHLLTDDANNKYVHGIESNTLDQGNRKGTTFKSKP